MSETEIRKGRLELFHTGTDLECACHMACVGRGIEDLEWDTWEDELMENFYEEFEIINNQLYIYKVNKEMDPYGFSEVTQNDDGSIDFFCMWYNGGGTLSEVIEYNINKN